MRENLIVPICCYCCGDDGVRLRKWREKDVMEFCQFACKIRKSFWSRYRWASEISDVEITQSTERGKRNGYVWNEISNGCWLLKPTILQGWCGGINGWWSVWEIFSNSRGSRHKAWHDMARIKKKGEFWWISHAYVHRACTRPTTAKTESLIELTELWFFHFYC